jgi:UDP-N-acetylglucosamine--N-acetylmuramyl-(pentapeptide) pyrophosphoryl-undecaprenol N-acetylglucosamine transferase
MTPAKSLKVLLATGGSGGHIFPALETALELQKRGHTVSFAGTLQVSLDKIAAKGFECYPLVTRGFNTKSLANNVLFVRSMVEAFVQSLRLLDHLKPDCVVGFGGHGSFPVMTAAAFRGYPTMIHEQNVVPGKANRVLSFLVKKVAVTFEKSIGSFRSIAVWTGCPCHDRQPARSRREILTALGLKPDFRTIVLLGGSQGSQRLNEIFFESAQILATYDTPVQVIHMTGPREFDKYRAMYASSPLPVSVSGFYHPVEEVYTAADIIISRAGAATVCELASWAVPAVLVPYPFAGAHQKYNARVLADAGAAILLEQQDLSVKTLITAIGKLCSPEYSRDIVRSRTQGLFMPDPAIRLADAVEQL